MGVHELEEALLAALGRISGNMKHVVPESPEAVDVCILYLLRENMLQNKGSLSIHEEKQCFNDRRGKAESIKYKTSSQEVNLNPKPKRGGVTGQGMQRTDFYFNYMDGGRGAHAYE